MSDGVTIAKMLADGDFDHALANAIEYGMIEGAKLERARIEAIVRCPEAVGREGSAMLLALFGNVTRESARGLLATIPALQVSATNVIDVRVRRAALKAIKTTR